MELILGYEDKKFFEKVLDKRKINDIMRIQTNVYRRNKK